MLDLRQTGIHDIAHACLTFQSSVTKGDEMRLQFMLMSSAVCLALAIVPVARGDDNETRRSDEAKIKAVIDRLDNAWNEHDMAKLAVNFTDDADFINVGGTWWKGRKQIEEAHAEAHRRFFGKSHVTLVDYRVKMLGPDTAVAIVTGKMEGHELPKGAYKTDYNRFTAVFVQARGEWKITSLENVNLAEPPENK